MEVMQYQSKKIEQISDKNECEDNKEASTETNDCHQEGNDESNDDENEEENKNRRNSLKFEDIDYSYTDSKLYEEDTTDVDEFHKDMIAMFWTPLLYASVTKTLGKYNKYHKTTEILSKEQNEKIKKRREESKLRKTSLVDNLTSTDSDEKVSTNVNPLIFIYFKQLYEEEKKVEKINKLREELIKEEMKEATFRPYIDHSNKYFRALSKKSSLSRIQSINEKESERRKRLLYRLSTEQKKAMRECTFKPDISKAKRSYKWIRHSFYKPYTDMVDISSRILKSSYTESVIEKQSKINSTVNISSIQNHTLTETREENIPIHTEQNDDNEKEENENKDEQSIQENKEDTLHDVQDTNTEDKDKQMISCTVLSDNTKWGDGFDEEDMKTNKDYGKEYLDKEDGRNIDNFFGIEGKEGQEVKKFIPRNINTASLKSSMVVAASSKKAPLQSQTSISITSDMDYRGEPRKQVRSSYSSNSSKAEFPDRKDKIQNQESFCNTLWFMESTSDTSSSDTTYSYYDDETDTPGDTKDISNKRNFNTNQKPNALEKSNDVTGKLPNVEDNNTTHKNYLGFGEKGRHVSIPDVSGGADDGVVARVSITIDKETTKVLEIHEGDDISEKCKKFVASNGLVTALVDTLVRRIQKELST